MSVLQSVHLVEQVVVVVVDVDDDVVVEHYNPPPGVPPWERIIPKRREMHVADQARRKPLPSTMHRAALAHKTFEDFKNPSQPGGTATVEMGAFVLGPP